MRASKQLKSLESKIEKLVNVLERAIVRGVLAGATADAPLNTVEAAAYLGKRPTTLAIWRARGEGPECTYDAFSSPRYTRASLDAFMVSGVKKIAGANVGRPPGRGKARRKAMRPPGKARRS